MQKKMVDNTNNIVKYYNNKKDIDEIIKKFSKCPTNRRKYCKKYNIPKSYDKYKKNRKRSSF